MAAADWAICLKIEVVMGNRGCATDVGCAFCDQHGEKWKPGKNIRNNIFVMKISERKFDDRFCELKGCSQHRLLGKIWIII